MTDQWSSAEAMLQWQIALARRRIEETGAKLPKDGVLYPLPKPKPGEPLKGTPGGWAFGNLAPHELGLRSCLSGLHQAESHLDRADAALTGGDLTKAIYWVIQGNQSIHSATAGWHSNSAIAQHRYVEEVRHGQKEKARKPRDRVGLDGETLGEIIEGLALQKDRLGDYLPAMELWEEFVSSLDAEGLDPKEEPDLDDTRKTRVWYGEAPKKKISVGTFCNRISKIRGGFHA